MVSILEDLLIKKDAAALTSRDVVNALITTRADAELRFRGINLAGADLSYLDLRSINFEVCTCTICENIIENRK